MADYGNDDADSEKDLCSLQLTTARRARETDVQKVDVAICPEALEHESRHGRAHGELLPGKDQADTEAAICKLADRPTKHLAKYKQSITCSYTPSIVGYYHLSRLLGGVGDIKPAVVRTMDLGEHKQIVSEAISILGTQADNSYPKVSWLSFQSAEATPDASRYKDATLHRRPEAKTSTAVSKRTRRPELMAKYSELNARGADPTPASIFMRSAQFQHVADARPLAQIVDQTLGESAAQSRSPAMRDISDMLVIDYLMSQQDRFGNIAEVDYYYSVGTDGKVAKTKKSKVDDGTTPKPAGAVLVKKMLLKDNDCGGPAKNNVVKAEAILDSVHHMNAGTYANLEWLAANFAPGQDVPKFLTSEVLFSQADINMLRTNLAALAPKLHDACTSGKLLLDLDLDAHLAGKGHDPASCNVAAPPKHWTKVRNRQSSAGRRNRAEACRNVHERADDQGVARHEGHRLRLPRRLRRLRRHGRSHRRLRALGAADGRRRGAAPRGAAEAAGAGAGNAARRPAPRRRDSREAGEGP